jgi:hypothetical protein
LNENELRALFEEPPARFRSAPFWSWNGHLDPAELTRQIAGFKAQGMGGFFIHSREGLETEYMGPEWMAAVQAVVEAARREGLYAWLYDEDRWPSGAAGGLVPARGGDAFRSKVLTLDTRRDPVALGGDVLAVYRARIEGRTLVSAERAGLEAFPALDGGEVALILRREVAGPTEWYNDDAPADNLNPAAVAAFIDITYEAYRQLIGGDFGGVVPGIFTDEPNVHDVKPRSGLPHVPWTDGLLELFAARRGYEFLDLAPYVFFDGASSARARHDFWWTISERFAEAYSKQIGEWCGEHALALTGHYLEENVMGFTVWRSGAVMPHYRYQQVPGIDMLCEQTHEYLTVKQCTSVAHQFGRTLTLSETYGCTGWAFTFEGQKWVGDWQYVLGITMRCQHLALYSLRGCRKRDYPPCFNYNTTWWTSNKVVEDYFARLGTLLTQGEPVRDVLVIHPLATAWTLVEGSVHEFPPGPGVQAANDFGAALNTFTQAVLAAHYDFDFGDEQIMADVGRVDGQTLWVNRAAYRVAIIPPGTRTLLASTVSLLAAFVAGGGRLIAFDPRPDSVQAVPDTRLADLFARPSVTVLHDTSELAAALEAAVPRRVGVYTGKGAAAETILTQQRTLADNHATLLFAVNNDRDSAHDVSIVLEGSGRLEEWDPLTGSIQPIAATTDAGRTRVAASFGPAGSRLYVLHHDVEPLTASDRLPEPARRIAAYVGPVCPFTRTDPNVLTLDVCAYRLGEGAWSEPVPVWQAQQSIRQQLGMRQVYYNGLPQRYKWINTPHPGDGAPVALRFTFEVRAVPDRPVFLALEHAADCAITLNGERITAAADGWYLDRGFQRVPLPALQAGRNTLVLEVRYTNRMEVEDCYLLGDFGVNLDRVLVAEPHTLHFSDWGAQGYLHYAGSIIYHATYEHTSGEQVILELGEVRATTVAVHVNGALAGHIPWRAANGLDLTALLVGGSNRIDVEVVGSPRNMLGPLHLKAGDEAWTDWRSFRTTGERYTPDYVVVPYGLMTPVRLLAASPDAADTTGPYLWEDR